MVHHLFDVLSVWFIVSLVILIAVEAIVVEGNESPAWGVFWLFAYLVAITAFTDARPWVWPLEHWFLSIVIVVVYIASGVGWAILKWGWYVQHQHREKKTSKDYLDPRRHENKSKIIGWMMWWPLSFFWWLMKWPRELFNAIYEQLVGTFQRIVDRAFATPKD